MTRLRALGIGAALLVCSAVLFAQEPERLGGRPLQVQGYVYLGASAYFQMEGTTADGFEFTMRADPTADTNYIWPATPGSAGQQLQTDGVAAATVLSWASAASSRAYKDVEGRMNPSAALTTVLQTPIYRFHYKPDAAMSTQDFATQYVGPMAEEAPWAMHHDGKILNPINTIGYLTAAMQAQQQQIEALRAELNALRAGR